MGTSTEGYNCLSCGNQLYFRSANIFPYESSSSKAIMKCDNCDITYGDPDVLKTKVVTISGTVGGEFDGVYKVRGLKESE